MTITPKRLGRADKTIVPFAAVADDVATNGPCSAFAGFMILMAYIIVKRTPPSRRVLPPHSSHNVIRCEKTYLAPLRTWWPACKTTDGTTSDAAGEREAQNGWRTVVLDLSRMSANKQKRRHRISLLLASPPSVLPLVGECRHKRQPPPLLQMLVSQEKLVPRPTSP